MVSVFNVVPHGPLLFFLLPISFILYWVIWILYARFFHPLKDIPGPFIASISHVWLVWVSIRGDMDTVQREMHQCYGPLVRIRPNEVACADPKAMKAIYPTLKPLTKTDFYPVWNENRFSKYPDNFSMTDEKLHLQRRRIVNNIYSLSNVLQGEKYMDKCSDLFMIRLGEIADARKTLDLGEWLQWYSFDVVGELFFGSMFGFMQNRHDHKSFISSLDALMPVISTVAISPVWWRPFILASSIFSSNIRRALKGVNHIAEAARTSVSYRVDQMKESQSVGDGRDILQQLLSLAQDKGLKVDFGHGEVVTEVWGGLIAGSDTTAIALRAVFYYLFKNPEAYRRLQAEIDAAVYSGSLSHPIRYAEAINLQFCCAVIKEAMRMHPSVGFVLPRIVLDGGLEVAGAYIPAGYQVGMNPAVVHYDRTVYGADAEVFRPARWLEDEKSPCTSIVEMEKHILTFGAGTRTCIGKNFSMAEIHKIVPQVLRYFEFELVHPEVAWKTYNHFFNKQTGLNVRIRRRAQVAL